MLRMASFSPVSTENSSGKTGQECVGRSSQDPWTTAALATLWNWTLFAFSCLLSSLCNGIHTTPNLILLQPKLYTDTRPRWGHSPVVSSHCAHIENPFSVAFLASIQKAKLPLICLKLACCYLTVLYDLLMKHSLNVVLK